MDGSRIQEVSPVIADLKSRFIAHEPYTQLRTQFDRLLYQRRSDILAGRMPEARGIAVIGNSGSGKTTAVERLIEKHPALNLGQDGSEVCEAVSVRVPSPATLKFVGETTLRSFGFPLASNKTSNQIWSMIQFHAQARKTLFVHYDEAQDFICNTSGKEIEDVIKTIKSFMQDQTWSVGLILSGMPALKDLLNLDSQLSRRFKPILLPTIGYTSHGPEIWEIIETYVGLVDLAVGKGINQKDFLQRLIHASASEFGITVEMITGAIEEALMAGASSVTKDHFIATFRSRAGCVDALNPFVALDYRGIDARKLLDGFDEVEPQRLNHAIQHWRKAS